MNLTKRLNPIPLAILAYSLILIFCIGSIIYLYLLPQPISGWLYAFLVIVVLSLQVSSTRTTKE